MDEVYDFGVILQKLRKEKGFTQEQLARLIHKESSIISRYEKGLQNPTFECRTLPDYRKDCGRVIKGQIKYPDKSALQLRFVGIYFLSNFFTVSHSYFPHTYTISAYTASLAHNLNIFSKP